MMNLKELEEYIDLFRDKGVTNFSCPEFSIALGPEPVDTTNYDDDDVSVEEAIRQAAAAENAPSAARGIFGNPKLWPGGVPPRFPGNEKLPSRAPAGPEEE